MSIDRTTYLIYGYKIEDEKGIDSFDEHYEELFETEPYSKMFNNVNSDQTIVCDQMCGNYVYIGIQIAKLDYEDDASLEIDHDKLNELDGRLNEYMNHWPDYVLEIVKNKRRNLFCFVHIY